MVLRSSISFSHRPYVFSALLVASSASPLPMTSFGGRKASSSPYRLGALFLKRSFEDSRRKLISDLNLSGNLSLISGKMSDASRILGYSIPTAFKTAFRESSTHSWLSLMAYSLFLKCVYCIV
jgi:hypothetical protein